MISVYKASEFVKPVYKAGETARVIGVTTETLRNYEDLRHDMPKDIGMSRYISHICGTYGILRRTANSIRFNMQGRINAYLALKKTELSQMEAKIQSTRMRISRLEFKVQKLKDLARVNSLDRKKLTDLRNGKASLYYQKNRLNRLVQRKNVLKQQIKERKVSLCFGTKKIV